jgi:hypothetical protein
MLEVPVGCSSRVRPHRNRVFDPRVEEFRIDFAERLVQVVIGIMPLGLRIGKGLC